ncbi:MAG: hypothetical protein JXB47_12930 [Anaerolineae bacterium]|nr:hypothetical protein [Anaerolineae bacterium]
MVIEFGRYSQHALRAIRLARMLAEQHRHREVDTGHLVVGILGEDGSLGGRVLRELGFKSRRAESVLERLYPAQPEAPGALDFSEPLRDALRLAIDEAHWLAHHYVGTEHQLLGIVRSGGGQAPAFFREHDISADQVRRMVRRLIQSGVMEIDLESARAMGRLSELSRRALNAAEHVARQNGHDPLSLVHLLLAISQEQRSPCRAILAESGFRAEDLKTSLSKPNPPTGGPVDVILYGAVEQADRLGSSYTGIDHMLLAISLHVRGRRILQMYGAAPKQVERRVRDIIEC